MADDGDAPKPKPPSLNDLYRELDRLREELEKSERARERLTRENERLKRELSAARRAGKRQAAPLSTLGDLSVPAEDIRTQIRTMAQPTSSATSCSSTCPPSAPSVTAGQVCGEIESTKSVGELYAPLTGEVVEVNDAAVDDPSLVNADPFGAGWLVKIRVDSSAAAETLDREAYLALTGGEE